MNEARPAPHESDTEARWIAETYQPNARQMTLRVALAGMALGGVMCVSNLYVFFKAGWSMGVTITAGILAFALFKALHGLRLVREPLSVLENNVLTTVASGAGYMTGGGNMAAFGALLMVTTLRPDALSMMLWFGVIAALGVFTAIPIKRQLINKEGLAFPTGTATAETLRAIHGVQSGGEGARQARWLAWSSIFAAVLTAFRALKTPWMPFNLPEKLLTGATLAGKPLTAWSLAPTTELVLVGAGGLMSLRTVVSIFVGSIFTYAILAPALVEQGLVATASYKAIVNWTVWPGASLLVASGITSFLLDWRSVARSFAGLSRLFGGGRARAVDPMDAIECPGWWFPAGYVLLAPVAVLLMSALFEIPVWAAILAVPLAILMGFIAARVTGETDVTPTKALGPVTQIFYGAITPGNVPGNIMSANVTGGIGLHAADLLTTIKTGWLLGGSPRAQFWAQLLGVAAGAAFIVPLFHVLFPDPSVLGGDEWPAPSCVVWASVSEAFGKGLSALDPKAWNAIWIGLALGVALALLEKFSPKRLKPWVPSPAGLGIAMVMPGYNGVAMFVGGVLAELLRRTNAALAARIVTPLASGLIAGESLMGVAAAIYMNVIAA